MASKFNKLFGNTNPKEYNQNNQNDENNQIQIQFASVNCVDENELCKLIKLCDRSVRSASISTLKQQKQKDSGSGLIRSVGKALGSLGYDSEDPGEVSYSYYTDDMCGYPSVLAFNFALDALSMKAVGHQITSRPATLSQYIYYHYTQVVAPDTDTILNTNSNTNLSSTSSSLSSKSNPDTDSTPHKQVTRPKPIDTSSISQFFSYLKDTTEAVARKSTYTAPTDRLHDGLTSLNYMLMNIASEASVTVTGGSGTGTGDGLEEGDEDSVDYKVSLTCLSNLSVMLVHASITNSLLLPLSLYPTI